MKKIYHFLLSMFFLFSSQAMAQETPVFEGKGDLAINAGLSVGVIGYGYGYYGSPGFAIPLTANVNYGIHEMFSVGPYVGYLHRNYGDNHSFTSLALGVQGTFHATPFLNENLETEIDASKVDLYAKLIVGYQAYSWRYNGESLNSWYYNDRGRPMFSPVLGVRYMFQPKLGGFAEGGRGAYGWLTLGVSVKL